MRMRKKRNVVLSLIFVLSLLLIGIYLAKHNLVPTSLAFTSFWNSRSLFHDHPYRVIHTIDHGCYLQTSDFTQHQHSAHLLAERGCGQKLPVALIVGGALCGTKTFKNALSFHPDVVVIESDLPIFRDDEDKDKNRFFGLMPHSLPNQVMIGESQEYLYSRNVSKVMLNLLGSDLKVIVLVRDPVARAMSEYLVLMSQSHKLSYRASLSSSTKSVKEKNDTVGIINASDDKRPPEVEHVSKKMKRHVRKESRKERYHNRDKRKTKTKSNNKHRRNKRSANDMDGHNSKVKGSPSNAVKTEEIHYNLKSTFEHTVLDSRNRIDGTNFLIQRSVYAKGIKRWKNLIPRENLLILDAEVFARDPATTMKIAEKFLKLKPHFKPDFFDFDLPNGVMCFNAHLRSCVEPFSVQRPLPVLADSLVSELREFLIPWIKVQNRIAGTYFPHLGEHPLVFTPFK